MQRCDGCRSWGRDEAKNTGHGMVSCANHRLCLVGRTSSFAQAMGFWFKCQMNQWNQPRPPLTHTHTHPHTHKHMHAHSHSLLTCFLVLLQPSFASELTLQLFQDDEQIEAATTSAIVPFGRTTFTYKSQQPLSVGGQVQCTFTVSTKQCVHPQNTFSGPCYFPSFSPSFCAAAAASTPGPLH